MVAGSSVANVEAVVLYNTMVAWTEGQVLILWSPYTLSIHCQRPQLWGQLANKMNHK